MTSVFSFTSHWNRFMVPVQVLQWFYYKPLEYIQDLCKISSWSAAQTRMQAAGRALKMNICLLTALRLYHTSSWSTRNTNNFFFSNCTKYETVSMYGNNKNTWNPHSMQRLIHYLNITRCQTDNIHHIVTLNLKTSSKKIQHHISTNLCTTFCRN